MELTPEGMISIYIDAKGGTALREMEEHDPKD
jgi:hypothetical protein